MSFYKKNVKLTEAAEDDKSFFKKADNGLQLERKHVYFYQCQGVVNILNFPWIDFIVFTEVDMHVERIYKDALLWKNIMMPELTNFFVIIFLKTVKRSKIIKTIIHQKSENIYFGYFSSRFLFQCILELPTYYMLFSASNRFIRNLHVEGVKS